MSKKGGKRMKKLYNKRIKLLFLLLLSSFIATSCGVNSNVESQEAGKEVVQQQQVEKESVENQQEEKEQVAEKEPSHEDSKQETVKPGKVESAIQDGAYEYKGKSYQIIEVDGGDRSGNRKSNVAVDIGYGDRVYWGLTNEYGQLVYVLADEIILQNDRTEPVNSKGRYYDDEANVPGTERSDLDQGHIIADSLGGVSNAYNITPQNSTLNRHGDQAYMEKAIREAGGCKQFVATITYPNTSTQIPSEYEYEYVIKGNKVTDKFPNGNPEATEKEEEVVTQKPVKETTSSSSTSSQDKKDLSQIDKNNNGKVTISEAKAAGYKMPIYSDHWLYPYMDDRDGDGVVGE